MHAITEFAGKYWFLSNFYPSVVHLDSLAYRTVEHAFQAAKTHDAELREKIRATGDPRDAKRLGRKILLRSDWEVVKFDIMRILLEEKFSDEHLARMLLDTGDSILVEGNTWGDRIWGQCPVGVGQNNLGKFLMQIRSGLKLRYKDRAG